MNSPSDSPGKEATITDCQPNALRILVAEFLLANTIARQSAAPSMLDEAAAMLKAVVADLAAVPDVEVTVLLNAEIHGFESAACKRRVHIRREELQPETLPMILQGGTRPFAFDTVLFIAPECNGVLVSLLKTVQESAPEVQTLHLPWRLAEIFADKYATAAWLRKHDIPTIPVCTVDDAFAATLLASACTTIDAAPATSINESCVLKPRDGAGAEGVRIVRLPERAFEDLPPRGSASDRWVLQPFMRGLACSVGFIGGGKSRPTTVLLPAVQHIQITQGRVSYRGGRIPCDPDSASRIKVVSAQIAAALGAFHGYIGADMLVDLCGQDNSPAAVRVVEINPRLCTSYVGYRGLACDNLATLLLQQSAESDIRWKPGVISFSADGTTLQV
ncbi:MAG: ATP-grasp domain-containing protein [Planctomycetaceae bacterium]